MNKNHSSGKKENYVQYLPSAESYSQMVDNMKDYSIITLDNDLRINSWNSEATSIFGYEPNEIIGAPFEIIFTEEDKKNNIPAMEIHVASEQGRAVDNRWHVCKDKTKFYAFGLVFPFTGADGEILGYIKILRDLSKSDQSEINSRKYVEELEKLNEHKEKILALLSHDLRSPLAQIISIAGYLKSNIDKLQTAEIKQMVNYLYDAGNDELNMLDYLVEWARIKYASQLFTPKKVDLRYYVTRVFETLQPSAAIKGVVLENKIKDDTIVFADGRMIVSIFQNIISNAIKHSRNDGKVTVTTKMEDDNVEIQIKDRGFGMSQQIQDKLFTLQMDELSKARKQNKGAGIGLLLTKSFVEANSGKIWVKSVEKQGTTFFFTLPVKKKSINPPE